MTTVPDKTVPGDFLHDWMPEPAGRCRNCGTVGQCFYRKWESADGALEDSKVECRKCGKSWWVKGFDSES